MMKINHEEINRVCGLTPETDRAIRGMWIEPGAILKVREVMDREGWVEPVIICDQNTYSLGDDLLENLENYDLICLDRKIWQRMNAVYLWQERKFRKPQIV